MKKLTAEVPDDVWRTFAQFARTKGYVQQRAVGAALRLFTCLSPVVREMLIEGHLNEAKAWLEEREKAWAHVQTLRALEASTTVDKRKKGRGGGGGKAGGAGG
jgi:hypothetical protein